MQGHWTQGGREQPITWFEAKGILEAIFKQLYLSVEYQSETTIEQLHPGRTASLWLNGNRLGIFGQLHPQLQEKRELPKEVYLFELNLSLLVEAMTQGENSIRKFSSFSTFPPSDRDIAFFVPVEVSVAKLEQCMIKAAGNLLESIKLFDEYRGEHVPEGQRSLAFRLVYRASDRTLTDAEIEPKQQKVREALVKEFNVDLRS